MQRVMALALAIACGPMTACKREPAARAKETANTVKGMALPMGVTFTVEPRT